MVRNILKAWYQISLEWYFRICWLIFIKKASEDTAASGRNIVVSLTVIPERLHKVHLAVYSLLYQSIRPGTVVLWLSDDVGEKGLPASLKELKKYGLHIEFCRDIGPHTKLIYALRRFPESVIVTADDDHFYMRHWLAQLLAAHERDRSSVCCHRGYRMKCGEQGRLEKYAAWELLENREEGPALDIFPTGVGGVLYPKGAFDGEVFNEDVFRKTCQTADDIWFKMMSLRKGTRCRVTGQYSGRSVQIRGVQDRALKKVNIDDGRNDIQLNKVADHYRMDVCSLIKN